MKKIITLTLVFCLMISMSLTGCVSSTVDEKATDENNEVTFLGENATDDEINSFITAKSDNPDRVVLKYASTSADLNGQSYLRGCREFLKVLKEELGDKIEIQYYLNGTFGGSADAILGGLQNGNFEMSDWPMASFAEFTNAFQPLDVPYLLKDMEGAREFYLGQAGEIMRQKCITDTNIRPMFYGIIGMRQMTNSKNPITSPSDLKGLKIRVQNNPLHIAGMKALGCAPTAVSFSELFTALQQKTVDGQENPIETIYNFQFYDVQKYLTLTNHLCALGTIAVSDKFYDGLDPEMKAAFDQASVAAEEYIVKDITASESTILEELKQKIEVTELADDQIAAFQDASKKAWPEIKSIIGEDYFNQVVSAAGLE